MAELRAKRRKQKEEAAQMRNLESDGPMDITVAGSAQEADARSREDALRRVRELEEEKAQLAAEIAKQGQLRAALLALHEPLALEATRLVHLELPPPFGEVDITVQQEPSLAHGGILWASGLALGRHLVSHADRYRALAGQQLRLLELGCGLAAIPSLIAAAVLGAAVVATDTPPVAALAADLVTRNLAMLQERGLGSSPNLAQGFVDVVPFAWSEELHPPAGPWDLILGADLLYDEGLQAALAASIAKASREGPQGRCSQLLLAYEVRSPTVEARFFERLRMLGAGPPVELELLAPAVSGARFACRIVEVSFNASSQEENEDPLQGLYL